MVVNDQSDVIGVQSVGSRNSEEAVYVTKQWSSSRIWQADSSVVASVDWGDFYRIKIR